ncbi:MAG: choice-of-anchor Q domain-containing protein, partial [Bacteroidota bacterium]
MRRYSMRFLSCLLMLFLAGSAHASTQITVNSLFDTDADDGQCTLREALLAANDDAASGAMAGECPAGDGDDVIYLDLTGTIILQSDLPDIMESVSVIGRGVDATWIDGAGLHGGFYSIRSGIDLTLRGLTIFRTRRGPGEASAASVGPGSALTIEFVRFFRIQHDVGFGSVSCAGGTLDMRWSTVEEADDDGGADAAINVLGCDGEIAYTVIANNDATGIFVQNNLGTGESASFDIRHTTLSANGDGFSTGGIVFRQTAASSGTLTLNIVHSTLTLNGVAPDLAAAGLDASGASNTLNIGNTVIAGNIGFSNDDVKINAAVTVNSLGHNFIGDNTGAESDFPVGEPNSNGDYAGKAGAVLDARLQLLADNGGPTAVHLPSLSLPVSPLLDKGSCAGQPHDQQGRARVFDLAGIANDDDGCDIGAAEALAGRLPLVLGATAYLYGAYDASSVQMREHPARPASQPYNTAPWNYSGSEATAISSGVADWVLVRLREDAPDGPIVDTGAGLLDVSGKLIEAGGSGAFAIGTLSTPPGAYYVELLHRNHVPAVSRMPAFLRPTSSAGVDLSDPVQVLGTNATGETVDQKFFALWPGDADGSGAVEPADA